MRLAVVIAALAIGLGGCADAPASSGPASASSHPVSATTPSPTASPTPVPSPSPTASAAIDRSPDPSGSLIEVDLELAIARTLKAKTAAIDATSTAEIAATAGTTASRTTGGAAFDGRSARLVVSANVPTYNEVVVNDGQIWVRGLPTSMVPKGTWVDARRDGTDLVSRYLATIANNSTNGALALLLLHGAPAGPLRDLGRGMAGGVAVQRAATTCDLDAAHVRVVADGPAMLARAIAALRLSGIEPLARCEVWIGDDGYVRLAAFDFTVPAGTSLVRTSVRYAFSQFGEPLNLRIRKRATIVEADDLRFPSDQTPAGSGSATVVGSVSSSGSVHVQAAP